MKKNALRTSMFSLCLILISAVLLNSCREEFIAANHHREKNITIKRLTQKDLDTNPKLSGKLSKLNALPSVNGVANRTYTNAQNGFTVETDEFVFIENGEGVKTYTFKIERPNTTAAENAPLENLVLTEISGDSLKAEIWKYNQVILNKQNPTVNDAKNYITISSIGNIGSSEIFYKANPCYGTVPNVVFEEPRNCPCEGHNYASIGDCKCSVKPTQGSYKIVYTTEFLCSGSGGGGGSGTANPGSGDGGGSTTPYPGGGGGFDPDSASPCKKLKEVLNKAPKNVSDPPGATVKDLLKDLEGLLPKNNPGYDGEHAYGVYQSTVTNNVEADYQHSTSWDEIKYNLFNNTKYYAVMHTHDDRNNVFSLADLYSIYKGIKLGNYDKNTIYIITTNSGFNYALQFADIAAFEMWAEAFFYKWEIPGILQENNPFVRGKEDMYEEDVKKTNTPEQNEKGFLKFLFLQLTGLNVMRSTGTDMDNWVTLTYDELKKTVKSKPCN